MEVEQVAYIGYSLFSNRVVEIHAVVDVWNCDLGCLAWRGMPLLVGFVKTHR